MGTYATRQLADLNAKLREESEILDWLERNHTLHRKVVALYLVDGYQVEIEHDCSLIAGPWRGDTLREAYREAMKHWDVAAI